MTAPGTSNLSMDILVEILRLVRLELPDKRFTVTTEPPNRVISIEANLDEVQGLPAEMASERYLLPIAKQFADRLNPVVCMAPPMETSYYFDKSSVAYSTDPETGLTIHFARRLKPKKNSASCTLSVYYRI